jgi:simple sugar transport system permease protein
LTGAFSAILCAHFTGSAALGILAAVLSALALAALQGVITLKLRANVFITGLAANLFAGGLTVVLSHRIFAARGVIAPPGIPALKTLSIPLLEGIPVLADILSGHAWHAYASWVLLFLCWLVLYKMPVGFRLRACGRRAQALVSLGLTPSAYRFAAFLISGVTCGLGGSFLSLNLGVFIPNISAGKGWIALVIIFLGNRKPLGILIAAFAFSLADAFSNYAQGILAIPSDFILAIPSIFTLLVMIGASILTKRGSDVRRW